MINKNRYDSIKIIFQNKGLSLSEEGIKLYANFFEVISHFTNGKLSNLEMIEAFDFLNDLITQKFPQFAINVSQKESLNIQLRFMEQLPQTAGKLTEEEKIAFAFCVFHATFVKVYDEKNDSIVSGIVDFYSVNHIKMLMEDEKKKYPELFMSIYHKEQQPIGEFGYSITNPICVTSIPAAYSYLNRLRYSNETVKFQRIGSFSDINGRIIDGYTTEVTMSNFPFTEKRKITIYIDAYSLKNSKNVPSGFTLLD